MAQEPNAVETNKGTNNAKEQTSKKKRPFVNKKRQNTKGENKPQNGGEHNTNEHRSNQSHKPKQKQQNQQKQAQKDPNKQNFNALAKDCMSKNEKIHFDRLNTHSKFGDANKSIKIVALGGLDNIGGNMTVFETEKSAVVVDVGLSFPSDDMHGVDILIPDFSYLKTIKHKLKAILITHAHEDHIGALAYLFKEIQVPIYASPLPLAMIGAKFDEHGLKAEKSYFRFVQKRRPIKIDDFEIEWIHMTHSVIDASSLAITTPAGTIIHTGDFKIDNTPIDGYPVDYHRLAYYGERGVLALFSDSTNSFKKDFTKSESVVGKTFDELFSKTKERVIMSTFSSNIHRVYQAITSAKKYGRRVAVIGRSMDKNLNLAMELGYIKIDKKDIIDASEASKLPGSEVLIVTTGSQGEQQSALFRMSINEHRHIKLKPTDTIIISAKAIPGNEHSVSTIINQILKTGAKVAYQEFSEIHVSGHASQEEQKIMIRLIKPKFFIPAHGEYQHIQKHAKTAKKCGIDEKRIIILDDGDPIELSQKGYKKLKKVKSGKIFIDNQINKQIDHAIVYDRQNLANDGIIMIILQIDKQNLKLIQDPKVMSYGLVGPTKEKLLASELEETINSFVHGLNDAQLVNTKHLENSLRQVVKKHIFRKIKKYPIIVPTLYIQ